MYQALYRKWRPRTFDDIMGQGHITDILKTQVQTGRLSHAYLFTGTRGTGKTSCAKILSRAVNCMQPVNGNPCNSCPACQGIENGSILDVLEIDAASNNGVDNVRALRDEAVFTPASVRMRVYIVDEVHMLSGSAFNALLKILEEPPAHLLFILATTEVHKVPATVLSRCQRFVFKRIMPDVIVERLRHIAAAEGIVLQDDAARILARLSDGALRDAVSLLDQCASGAEVVDCDRVHAITGMAGQDSAAKILQYASAGDTSGALDLFEQIYSSGAEVTAVMDELSALCRDIMIYKLVKEPAAFGFDSAGQRDLMEKLSSERLLEMLFLIRECQSRARYSTDRRVDAELCIMQLCLSNAQSQQSILPRLERLERLLEPARTGVPEEKQARHMAEQPAQPEAIKAAAPKKMPQKDSGADINPENEPHRASPGTGAVPAAGAGGFDWSGIVERVKNNIAFVDYQILASPHVDAKRSGDTIQLFVDNGFAAERIREQKLQTALKEAAGTARLEVIVGSPEQEEDRFGELLSLKGKYDNIEVE